MGYDSYVSYILNENKRMQNYAEKWGMQTYKDTEKGKWYYKQLKGE